MIHYNGFGFYCMAAVIWERRGYMVFVDVRFLWLFLRSIVKLCIRGNDKVHSEAAEVKHCRFLEQL